MKLVFIRHGATKSNLEKRYIGRTDEPLCGEGIAALIRQSYPACEKLVVSPAKRCIRTAKLIYPAQKIQINSSYRECDFGNFEGKNFQELSDDPDYQKWIDSGGAMPFPNGEDPDQFRKRCEAGFIADMVLYADAESVAFVVHGGTIMAILSRFAGGNFYDYQIPNGGGYLAEFEKARITRLEKL